MTLKLELSDGLQNRLRRAAQQRGLSDAEFALQALQTQLNGSHDDDDRRAAVLKMLREWDQEDAAMTPAQLEQSDREWKPSKRG